MRGYLPAIQRLAEAAVQSWAEAGGSVNGLEMVRHQLRRSRFPQLRAAEADCRRFCVWQAKAYSFSVILEVRR